MDQHVTAKKLVEDYALLPHPEGGILKKIIGHRKRYPKMLFLSDFQKKNV